MVARTISFLFVELTQVSRPMRKKFDLVVGQTEMLIVEVEKHPILYPSVKSGVQIYARISSSFSSSVWRGKMLKCHQHRCLRRLLPISAHIAAATARITVFCMNGGPCEISSGKSWRAYAYARTRKVLSIWATGEGWRRYPISVF